MDIREVLQGDVPGGVSWGSLEATYQGQQNVLAAELISVSQSGKHTMRSVMNWVQGSASEGWHWRADADYNTLIGIYNADSEEARVLVSLDYQSGGQQHSYELPEFIIPPRVSELVDVAQALASGQVDADAELTGVTTGGYRVQKVGPRIDKPLLTETLVVNRRTKNFETFYNTCCNLSSVQFLPSSLLGPVGGGGQLEIHAYDSCSGQFINFTSSGSYSSFNSSIASVGSSTGSASYVNPGDTTLRSVLNFFRPANCFTRSCDPSGPCEAASAQGDTPTEVFRITSLTPSRGLVGTTVTVTINGQGLANAQSVSAGTGITVTIQSKTSTQIEASFAISSSAPEGDHSVTVNVGGVPSNSLTFFVQVPTALQVWSKSVLPTGTGGDDGCRPEADFGIRIAARYQVLDQLGTAIQDDAMRPQETVRNRTVNGEPIGDSVPDWSDIGGPGNRHSEGRSTFTNSEGRFVDVPMGVCADNVFVYTATQTISILVGGEQRYIVRINDLRITSVGSGIGSITQPGDLASNRP